MLWEDVFCQSKRSVTGCREQGDLVLSQKKVQSAADMLWVAFIEFYWAWYAEELQVTTISASLFTSLRAWCRGVLLLLLFQPPQHSGHYLSSSCLILLLASLLQAVNQMFPSFLLFFFVLMWPDILLVCSKVNRLFDQLAPDHITQFSVQLILVGMQLDRLHTWPVISYLVYWF
jgi:hypothetical protein